MMKQTLSLFFLILISINSAFALTLKEAKSQGLVGERNDGYVGYVISPATEEVKALVKGVNNKRKAKFESTASSNNLKVEQVSGRFYQRAIAATQVGHYYQDSAGSWVKKQ